MEIHGVMHAGSQQNWLSEFASVLSGLRCQEYRGKLRQHHFHAHPSHHARCGGPCLGLSKVDVVDPGSTKWPRGTAAPLECLVYMVILHSSINYAEILPVL